MYSFVVYYDPAFNLWQGMESETECIKSRVGSSAVTSRIGRRGAKILNIF